MPREKPCSHFRQPYFLLTKTFLRKHLFTFYQMDYFLLTKTDAAYY